MKKVHSREMNDEFNHLVQHLPPY